MSERKKSEQHNICQLRNVTFQQNREREENSKPKSHRRDLVERRQDNSNISYTAVQKIGISKSYYLMKYCIINDINENVFYFNHF